MKFKQLAINNSFTAKVIQVVSYEEEGTKRARADEPVATKLLLDLYDSNNGESMFGELVDAFNSSTMSANFRPRINSKVKVKNTKK